LSCGKLTLTPGNEVTGFVGSNDDMAIVRAALTKASPAAMAAARIDVRPWPQCEALLTLAGPLERPNGLAVALDRPPTPCKGGTLCSGDALVATVQMPRSGGYLYVGYLQAQGEVVLLDQPRSALATPRRPGEMVVLGRGPGQPGYSISAPYGREMLIAIAAQSPLFDTPLPSSMIEREFLTVIRKALIYKPRPSDADRVVSAALLPISTAAP
jgi:hypothetical protein